MLKKDVTVGNLLTIAILLIGGLIAFHVRLSISEERNNAQDAEIESNKAEIKENRDKTDAKLDKIIDLIIDLNTNK